jgi:DNA helicase HerA-like ATPase
MIPANLLHDGRLVLVAVLAAAGAAMIATFALRLLSMRRQLKKRYVCIEVAPPMFSNRTPQDSALLFKVLHGKGMPRKVLEKLLRRRMAVAPEVVAKGNNIRYLFRVDQRYEESLRNTLIGHSPQVKLEKVDDYLADFDDQNAEVIEFKLRTHWALPLKKTVSATEHDPLTYLLNTLTRLQGNEIMAFQIALSPRRFRKAGKLSRKSRNNKELLLNLGNRKMRALHAVGDIVPVIVEQLSDVVSILIESAHDRKRSSTTKVPTVTVLDPVQEEHANTVRAKLNNDLFYANVRVLIKVDGPTKRQDRAAEIKGALEAYAAPDYQGLEPRYDWLRRYRLFLFRHRLPALLYRNRCILDIDEIASLYHLPYDDAARTEGLVKSLSRRLPPPPTLQSAANLDVQIGINYYHNQYTELGLTAAQRTLHQYIIGATGRGKTTMLEYQMVQDIRSGKGLAIIDPHGDSAERVLRLIPEERKDDVIYLDPHDTQHPIGINPMEVPEGLTGDELLIAQEKAAESVVDVFRKIFSSDDTGGHRIEHTLRNAVHTAFALENPTIFTVLRLLNDEEFLDKAIAKLKDQSLINYWNNEYKKGGAFQQVKSASGVTTKIGRFQRSVAARRVFGQAHSTINFDEILNGKILICNLSKGKLLADTSQLFGTIIMAQIQLATLKREAIPEAERKPFYVYVDEFQNFASPSFEIMVAESRKYGVSLIMAEQTTSQQDKQTASIIFGNVDTIICFKTGNPEDERLLIPLFEPFIKPGDIKNLPPRNFYAKLGGQEPTSGMTVIVDHSEGSDDMRKQIKESSRKNYALDPSEVAKLDAENTASEPRSEPTKPPTRLRRPDIQNDENAAQNKPKTSS